MKALMLCLMLSLVSGFAYADTLKCWNVYGRRTDKVPLLTATIVSNSELADLTVISKGESGGFEDHLQANGESVLGTLITTRRSPYVGNNEFLADDFRLILPPKLDSASLRAAQETGIGMGKGENGVAIGSFDDGGDGAGSHISVRLRCRSYSQ